LPDGVTLLTYSFRSKELTLWDTRSGEPVGALTADGFGRTAALSADGTTLAAAYKTKMWVYDLPSRQLRHLVKFPKDFRFLAFHPNGRLLASASTNSVITLWDAVTGTQVNRFDWKTGQVKSLAFAPDGLTCAAGGFERFVIWDVDL